MRAQLLTKQQTLTPALSQEKREYGLLLLAAILLAGFALRVFRLDFQSMWFDETYTVDIARQGLSAIAREPVADPLPDYLLQWAWRRGAGDSAYAARYLSLLMGMLALALTYRLLRRFVSRAVALAGTAAMAVSALAVYYSQEARLHMLGCLLTLAAACALLAALRRDRAGWWALYGLLATASLYSYYYAALALAGMNLPLLLSRRWRKSAGWWLSNAIALVALLPWLAVVYGRFAVDQGGETTFLAAPNPLRYLLDAPVFVLFGRTADPWFAIPAAVLLTAVTAIVVWRLRPRDRPSPLAILAGYALAPVLGVYAIALARPGIYDPRYLIVALPAWIALLAFAADRVAMTAPTRLAYLMPAGLLFLVPTGLSLANNYFDPALARDDYRGLFQTLRSQALPDEVLIYDSPRQVTAVHDYFADQPIPAETILSSASAADLDRQLANLTSGASGIWLMVALDRRHTVEQWLDQHEVLISPEGQDGHWYGGGLRLKHYRPGPLPIDQAALPQGQAAHLDFGDLRLEQITVEPAASGRVPIRMLWSVPTAPAPNYTVSLQLFDAAGAQRQLLDEPPLGGQLPTSAWKSGYAYSDATSLSAPGPGLYQLRISVYDPAHQPAGSQQAVAVVSNLDGWKSVPLNARTSSGWTLSGVRLRSDGAGHLAVAVQAKVDSAPSHDYTWFAHVLDAAGNLAGQDDHRPLSPPITWHAGDRVLEYFSVPNGPRLELGAYDSTGQRVTFALAGGSQVDSVQTPT